MAEYVEAYGNLPSEFDIRDYKITPINEFCLPEEFELDPPPVKNQFAQGTCTAFSSSEIVEYHHQRQTNEYVPYSTEFIYGMRFEEGDSDREGLAIRKALQTLYKYGDPTAQDCPGNSKAFIAMSNVKQNYDNLLALAEPTKISGYARVEGEYSIKTALQLCGPVVASVNWANKYYTDASGVIHFSKDSHTSRHAIIIYGWNKKGWMIQNSWGLLFGLGGRAILPYTEKINEAWCIYDNNVESSIRKTPNNSFFTTISKIINWIVNLLTSLKNN